MSFFSSLSCTTIIFLVHTFFVSTKYMVLGQVNKVIIGDTALFEKIKLYEKKMVHYGSDVNLSIHSNEHYFHSKSFCLMISVCHPSSFLTA